MIYEKRIAFKWLPDGRYELAVCPLPETARRMPAFDRSHTVAVILEGEGRVLGSPTRLHLEIIHTRGRMHDHYTRLFQRPSHWSMWLWPGTPVLTVDPPRLLETPGVFADVLLAFNTLVTRNKLTEEDVLL